MLTTLLLLTLSSPAFAWWEYGHQTIAGIAYAQATPQTRAAIRRLIHHARELDTPTCPVRNIEDASIWPDCIKPLKDAGGVRRFGYAYTWHFQDVDICKPFDLATPCADGNCVSAQITRQAARLHDRHLPPRERLMALAFLVHFVGDLHQPLHAGEHDDQGGNKVPATYGVGGKLTNLHSIWDGYLAERAISSPPGGVHGLLRGVTPRERHALASGNVTTWSAESYRISRAAAYGVALGADPCTGSTTVAALDEAKIQALIPVVRRQVLEGGLRLGRMLNAALG